MNLRLMASMALLASPLWAISGEGVLEAFEGDGFGDWKVEGSAFGMAPVPGVMDGLNGRLSRYAGRSLACSAHGGDTATGTLTSSEILVSEDHLAFLVAGGNQAGKTAVQLLVDGEVKLEAVGENTLMCRQVVWDVSKWRGRKATLRIVDAATGSWGMIAADHFMLSPSPDPKMPAVKRENVGSEVDLVGTAAISGATIPEGTTLTVLADHESHQVTSPTALAQDESGAWFVTETHRFRHGVEDNRDHLNWYLDDLAAQTLGDRSALIEKWKGEFPDGYFTERSEVVRRLDGRGEDGRFASSLVFADGFNDVLDGTAAGVFAMDGVVYLASIPKIHTLADTDNDGLADARGVVQDGFGVRFSLSGHDLNGFELGPDGRLYGTVGDRGLNLTTLEGVKYALPDQGAAFRFDPDGTNFEVIHTGLRNPKELAFDAYGNAISVDNNSDQGDEARIVYIVDGADSGWRMEHQAMHTFHRQIGLEERPLGAWMVERMWEPANDAQPAFMLPPVANLTSGPSGLSYHPGAGFLEAEQGRFLICDYRGSAAASGIWSFRLEPSGAGMKLVDSRKLTWGTAATDVTYSWDGRVFVSDFIGGWTTHEAGRIYQIEADAPYLAEKAKEASELIAGGFDHRSVEELADLLKHPDMRVRTRAHLALTRKEGALEKFAEVVEQGEGFARLHAIWGLGVMARRGAAVRPAVEVDDFVELPDRKLSEVAWELLMPLLTHDDAEVRAQSIKVLGESGIVGDRINFGQLLEDESPRVQMLAALAAGRTKAVGSLPYVWEMIIRNGNRDAYLSHAGAFALERLSNARQLQVLHAHQSQALRLAAVVALGRMKDDGVAWFLADQDADVVAEAIRMIHDGGMESVRPVVAKLLDEEKTGAWSEMTWIRVLHSAYRLGDTEQVGRILRVALDEAVPKRVRGEALRLLKQWSVPHPVDQSIGRYSPLPKRDPKVAIDALADQVGALLKIEGELRVQAIEVIQSHQLDTSAIADEELEASIRDSKLPGAARAKTLEIYHSRGSQNMDSLLVELSGMENDVVALEAIRRLLEAGSEKAAVAVENAVRSPSVRRQQEGWKLARTIDSPEMAALIASALNDLKEAAGIGAAAIEMLETAEGREEAEVKQALEAYRSKMKESNDPLAMHYPSLQGGDAKRGRALFRSHPGGQCMRCHIVDGGHGAEHAGPSLAGVGTRGDRKFLLESLVAPGARVAAGFGVVSIELKDGSTVGGTLMEETPKQLVIDVAGESATISREQVKSMSAPFSSMPPMGALLDPEELRDLVAWLATLTEER